MRNLLIHSYIFPTGGDWTYITNHKDILENNGEEVAVFGLGQNNHKFAPGKHDVILNGNIFLNGSHNEVSLYGKVILFFNVLFNFTVFKKLSLLLKTYKPDIIQLNSIHTSLSPSVLLSIFLYSRKSKIIWRILDYKLVCPNRTLSNIKNNDCRSCVGKLFPSDCITNKCKNDSYIISTLFSVENFLINIFIKSNLIDIFSVQSKFSKQILLDSGISKEKIKIIYNPLNSKISNSEKSTKSYDFVYFGRLSKEKGVQLLIDSIKDTKFRLLIIGDGPLKNIVTNEVINHPNIHYIGAKWGDDLIPFIKSSMATVIPSLWNEVSPYVLLESFRCGIPVIASDSGGTKDLIIEGFNGLTFESGSRISLVKRLNQFSNEVNLYDGDAIVEYFKYNFSYESYFQKYKNLLND